tara:strand:+ start:1830 stop:2129 length:300 start_codon:yes stop_codon:yes gene_type:complete
MNSNHIEKSYFNLKGTVHAVGELVHIKRDDIPDLYKKVLTVETPDGQVLYPELRNGKLKMLEAENITQGSTVEIQFLFQGSEKNNKRYNNIYIYSIKSI